MSDSDDFFADDVLPEVPQPAEAEVDPDGPQFGQGDLPGDLNRFNVSAFVWGGWWSLAYGLWPRLFVQLALAVVNYAVLVTLRTLVTDWPRSLIELAPQIGLGLFIVAINAWFAASANARAWQNATRRISGERVTTLAKSARGSVGAFRKVQGDYAKAGLGLWAILVIQPLLNHISSPMPLSTIGSLVQSVVVFASAAIAWAWLRRKSA